MKIRNVATSLSNHKSQANWRQINKMTRYGKFIFSKNWKGCQAMIMISEDSKNKSE